MKKQNLCLAMCLMVLTAAFYSCSKSAAVKPKTTTKHQTIAEGYWYGSFTDAANTKVPESMLFRNDGTCTNYDFFQKPSVTDTTKSYDGQGTYILQGNGVTFTFTYPNGQVFSGSGTINTNNSPATMSLTYNGTGSPPSSGTIDFTFQN
jgi:hypothetical protein